MGDAGIYDIDTVTVVACDVCDTENTVTVWDNIRTGRWEQEAFTCTACGEFHRELDGSALDRGAASVYGLLLFTLMTVGAGLALPGVLSILGGHIPTMWPLTLAGIALAGAAFTLALFYGANQNGQDQ